jgi:hypothetical protein
MTFRRLSSENIRIVLLFLVRKPGPIAFDRGAAAGRLTIQYGLTLSPETGATSFARLYPQAEVHALDIAPGRLRYASARAESMNLLMLCYQRGARDLPSH